MKRAFFLCNDGVLTTPGLVSHLASLVANQKNVELHSFHDSGIVHHTIVESISVNVQRGAEKDLGEIYSTMQKAVGATSIFVVNETTFKGLPEFLQNKNFPESVRKPQQSYMLCVNVEAQSYCIVNHLPVDPVKNEVLESA
jgi:hypothetical protein